MSIFLKYHIMNLQQLEYIVAVEQFKNFSRAAEYCHVTQATLSAMVKKLEEELELTIFDRKANPIIPTDSGKIILEEAKKILLHSQLMRDKAKSIQGKIAGKLKLGIIPTIAGSLLPKIIRLITTNHPELKLEIHEITTQNIIKQLKDGQIDAGILATPLDEDAIEENILYYEALMVYGNFDAAKQYLMPEEIRENKIWMLEEGHCLREQFINICNLKKKENQPKNLKFEAGSFETLLAMVDEFDGLTLIPELYYQTLSEEKKKKVRNFIAPIPVREVSMVFYRPFAKLRIINTISEEISALISKDLISGSYKKSELAIAKI
jgi:LysR family transcriptional regulator, hydrogen peroxide-inducible genes activator